MFALIVLVAAAVFGPYCGCQVVSVRAGDTFEIKSEIFPGTWRQFVIQLSQWDAPNVGPVGSTTATNYMHNARCELERTKGQAALAAAKVLIEQEADHEFEVINLYRPIQTAQGLRYPGDLMLNAQPDGYVGPIGAQLVHQGHVASWYMTVNDQPSLEPWLTRPSWC